jgi:hypothetical protein
MKLTVRRIGNSLGVILPKASLAAWGIGEGDSLDLTDRGIHAPQRGGLSHAALDNLKRSIACAVARRFTAQQIRAQILANLHRWKSSGMWVSAYGEWLELASAQDEGCLFAAMLGRDDNAVRLRQSMPFTGLLSQNEVKLLHEEATA